MANYKVGDIIRLTRKSVGMSQEEIAFLAELTPETISRIESGKHKITQNTYGDNSTRANEEEIFVCY